MDSLEKMEWESKYSVDIEEIDNHQKKMFELFDELIDMKELNLETKEYINMIAKINEYSRVYFSAEEKLLRKNGYPDFGEHAKAHRQFTKNFISLRREISDDVENLSWDVIAAMRNWMTNHILTFDSLYVPFLRINKYVEQNLG